MTIEQTKNFLKAWKPSGKLQNDTKTTHGSGKYSKRTLTESEVHNGRCTCGGCIWCIDGVYHCGDCTSKRG